LALSEDELKFIFSELDISWASMLEVEETCLDLWSKKGKAHLADEADTDALGFRLWAIRNDSLMISCQYHPNSRDSNSMI
jgi:hypothetical protein